MFSPGPTNTIFDVLAAGVSALAQGPHVLLLGFAGGGTLAPLRAMGWEHPIAAVDLSLAAQSLFKRHSAAWAGDVRVSRSEASAWLRRRRHRWDAIVEDLSVAGERGVTKPSVSIAPLPRLMRSRLRRGGIVIVNVLRVPGRPWPELLAEIAAPFPFASVVTFADFENRILFASAEERPVRAIGAGLRSALLRVGSRQARRISVRTLS
jgi:spermidine synthase